MKNVLKGIGICVLCFILFSMMQLIVSNIISFPVGVKIGRELRQEAIDSGKTITAMDPETLAEATRRQSAIMAPYALPIAELGGALAVGVLALVALIRKKKVSEALGFKKVSPKALGFAALVGVLYNAVVMLYSGIINSLVNTGYQEATSALTGGSLIVTAICVCICAPIIEEIIFRGTAFRASGKLMPKVVAAAVASLFFALAHGTNLVWLSYTFVMGLVACYLTNKYESILPSILFHVVFNLLGSVILPYCPAFIVIPYLAVGTISAVIFAIVMIVKAVKSKNDQSERRPEIVTAA